VAAHVADAALARGFIVNPCTPHRVRLAPPLVLTYEQAGEFLAAWPGIVESGYAAAERSEAR
jgi:acetylornithine aminotransferase